MGKPPAGRAGEGAPAAASEERPPPVPHGWRGRDWPGNAAGGWRRLLAPSELSRARAERRARLLPPERPREQPEEERRAPGCSPREPPAWVRDSRTLPIWGDGSPSRSRRGGGGGRSLRGHTARSPPPLLALPSTLLFWRRSAPSRTFLSASLPGPGKGEGMGGEPDHLAPRLAPLSPEPSFFPSPFFPPRSWWDGGG